MFRWTCPAPAGTRRLDLVFNSRQGGIRLASSTPPPDRLGDQQGALWFPLQSRLFRLEWDEPLPEGTPVTVELEPLGSSLVLYSHRFSSSPGTGGDTRLVLPPELLSPEQILEWRETRAEAEPELAPARRFFNEIDRETRVEFFHSWSGTELEKRARATLMARLSGFLVCGHERRPFIGASPYGYRQPFAREELRAVSRIFVDAWERHLGGDLAAAERAFILFASRQLMLIREEDLEADPRLEQVVAACQPDSWYYFLFAELADLCDVAEVDPAFWKPLLLTLIWTQQLLLPAGDSAARLSIGPARPPRPDPPQPLQAFTQSLAAFKESCLATASNHLVAWIAFIKPLGHDGVLEPRPFEGGLTPS